MNKKIGYKGFASLLFFLSQEIFLGIGLTRILSISEQNSWISIIIAFLIGFIFLGMIIYVMDYEKDLTVFEKNEKLFGKFGKVINFVLAIIEFLASIFGLVNYLDFSNFKPLFTNSFNEIISSSFIIMSYFITPFSLLLLVPKNTINEPKKLNKSFICFYIIGFLELFLVTTFIISIFGIDYAKLFYYPEFSLLKKISYFDFIEHVENLLSSQWLFSLYIGSVVNLYFIKNYLKKQGDEKGLTF